MIGAADAALRSWLTPVVDKVKSGVEISLEPPSDDVNGDKVHLYLLDLADHPPLRGPDRAPRQFMLRYLVTTASQELQIAHDLLGETVLAAMAHDDFEVHLVPQEPALWHAFGIAPRPAFILCVPVRREWPRPDVPLAEGLTIGGTPMGTLFGLLLGPADTPLARARIEYPALRRSATTDTNGRFSIPGAPADTQPKNLVVKARGQVHQVVLTGLGSPGEPEVIRIDLLASSPQS